ncbi:MAG: DedA family protein, partial [Anaerotignaceae bacterium]
MAGFIHYLSGLIKNWGYIGILTTVGMEYACFPISSEILLPFIGYSVYLGELSLPLAIIFSTVGGIFGSSFCYGVGRFGRNILKKISKNRFLAMKEGIKRAEVY